MLRKSIGMSAGLCLMMGGFFASPSLDAQEAGAKVTPPPKVLVLDLEILKPGKAGAPHQKTESLFVTAAKNAKSPNHYLASQALTGPPRALFSYGYDSFAGFEKQFKQETTGSLGAQIDSALQADGDLLESTRRGVFVLHDDMSVNAPCAIGTMRYFQITHVKIHPGKYNSWRDFLKIWRMPRPKQIRMPTSLSTLKHTERRAAVPGYSSIP
jgi:hypothetical protein